MHFLLIFLALGFGTPTPALAQQLPPIIFSTSTAEDIITSYAIHYGIPAQSLIKTLKCESGFNKDAINLNDPNGGSKGVAQFQDATFAKYSKLAGLTKANVWNPLDSIQVAAYMFSIGQQHQWSCFNEIYGSESS